jgi:hypothetical protein
MAKAREPHDASLAPAPVLKAMLEVTARLQNLQRDLKLIREKIDRGDAPASMVYGVLSAQLMAAELQQRIVQLQIALAYEVAE